MAELLLTQGAVETLFASPATKSTKVELKVQVLKVRACISQCFDRLTLLAHLPVQASACAGGCVRARSARARRALSDV